MATGDMGSINWMVVATIAGPIVGTFFGVILGRMIESRTRLVTYYGHISSFTLRDNEGKIIRDDKGVAVQVHTHAVIIKNTGGKAATNVRLVHNLLPTNFQIFPATTKYRVDDLPDGGKEIVIPLVVPREELLISYLYPPPVTYNQINTFVKSDEGFAKGISVLLAPQTSTPLKWILFFLLLVGTTALIYLLYVAALWLFVRKF